MDAHPGELADWSSNEGAFVNFLKTYLDEGFTPTWISEILDIPLRTLRNWMKKFNLKYRNFSDISDDELDTVLHGIMARFPNKGARLIKGQLNIMNIKIPRKCFRESYKRVTQSLGRPTIVPIRRRVYHVEAPLSLWHLDGHHKLIRYRLVSHACVDGYSRLVVFVNISNNNRAETVLNYFRSAVEEWGLPAKVKSDRGMENIGVCDYMLMRRPNSFSTTRSVHNQRVERLWRDYFRSCIYPFYAKFWTMEQRGILNPDDDIDIFALHYVVSVFLPTTVELWKQGWNSHSLSSENEMTPRQMYLAGLELLRQKSLSNGSDPPELQCDHENINEEEEENRWNEDINVPPANIHLSPADCEALSFICDPQQVNFNNLVVMYEAVTNYLKSR